MDNDPLQQLRDIHEPLKPHWWPLAASFWALFFIIFFVFLFLLYLYIKKIKPKKLLKKEILLEIKSIEDDFIETKNHKTVQAKINSLIRRVISILFNDPKLKAKELDLIKPQIIKFFGKKRKSQIDDLLFCLSQDRFSIKNQINGEHIIILIRGLIKKCL